jgi:ketosteroid isomerase-like protein
VVRSIYERWNRDPAGMAAAVTSGITDHDDFALDLFDPAVEIRQIGAVLDTAGTFHGHAGMLRAAKELHEAFETIEWMPERWTEEGEWLIVSLRMVAVGDYSGIETETPVAHAWRVRDGRVTDFRVYENERKAVEATRLGE